MHLDAEVASVNVVSEEEIPRSGGVASDFKEFHQVVLVMDKLRMCQADAPGRKGFTYWPWISPQTEARVSRRQIHISAWRDVRLTGHWGIDRDEVGLLF